MLLSARPILLLVCDLFFSATAVQGKYAHGFGALVEQ
jgi:hypothetical protein